MTEERLIEIMRDENIETDLKGDNAFKGLQIIDKYISSDNTLICGARYDIIYSVDVEDLVNAGITEEDAIKLRSLNWMVEDDSYLACFV